MQHHNLLLLLLLPEHPASLTHTPSDIIQFCSTVSPIKASKGVQSQMSHVLGRVLRITCLTIEMKDKFPTKTT
jgi:hypothetical protein